MKIAVDFREASKKDKTGKGWFAYNLMKNVFEQDAHNQYILYTDSTPSDFPNFKNIEFRLIKSKSIFWHLKVLRDLKCEKPDLFLALTSFIIPALAPKNLKTIITVHDLVAFLFPVKHNRKAVLIEKLTLKKALKKATSIITISKSTESDLIKLFAKKIKNLSEKITIIPCAASENFKKLSPTEQKNLENFKYILGVGTLEPRKNFEKLIDAFNLISKTFPALRLVIIGGKGWSFKKHESERIIFKGYATEKDLIQYYNSAEVFIFPSLYEGFGIPPLEAMQCDCPVISSNVSSMPEVIGSAGLLINPNDVHELAEAIKSVLTNQDLKRRLVAEGHIQSRKFSYKSSAQKLIKLFKKIT
ncbi:MAG: group 1 glycosyl transferase [Candidatus Peregrinibacteria bacterium GW2011_GWC2_39_14]|nr:MAG: Glycosyl transferase group 1 [Candidatus Peregrinibacteria bacterium GW2011_GWA2_38_36]KKR05243.1 MAG: group 1 glycosyl transferase [Candidatus Peregrinibacteria bacterium GW2011_GWC2_39_14]